MATRFAQPFPAKVVSGNHADRARQGLPGYDVIAFNATWSKRIGDSDLAKRVMKSLWEKRRPIALLTFRRDHPQGSSVHQIAYGYRHAGAHMLKHFRALLGISTLSHHLQSDPFIFVRLLAARSARDQIPLRELLQLYSSSHKSLRLAMGPLIDELAGDRETAMRTAMLLSEYCIEYTDLISAILTEAYEAEVKVLQGESGGALGAIDDLLQGLVPRHGSACQLYETAGFESGMPMVVVLAHLRARVEEAGTAHVRALVVSALEAAFSGAGLSFLVAGRGVEVTSIVGAPRQPGALAAMRLRGAASEAASPLRMARIGLGLEALQISELPRALSEARAAVHLNSGTSGVLHLGDVSVDDYLCFTADETARRLAPRLPNGFARSELARTIEALAKSNLTIKACARSLRIHPNSVYHRLNRVRRLTGLDPRTYSGLNALMKALAFTRADERGLNA